MKQCPYCAEPIKAEAIKCRFCGSELAKHPPKDGGHNEPSQEKAEAASLPSWTCPSCGASIFAAQTYCDVCSPTIWKPGTQSAGDTSKAGAETWHLILDRRVAEERREVLLTALGSMGLDPAVRTVNEREVNVASGATLQQANALMISLHDLGVISRKERD